MNHDSSVPKVGLYRAAQLALTVSLRSDCPRGRSYSDTVAKHPPVQLMLGTLIASGQRPHRANAATLVISESGPTRRLHIFRPGARRPAQIWRLSRADCRHRCDVPALGPPGAVHGHAIAAPSARILFSRFPSCAVSFAGQRRSVSSPTSHTTDRLRSPTFFQKRSEGREVCQPALHDTSAPRRAMISRPRRLLGKRPGP